MGGWGLSMRGGVWRGRETQDFASLLADAIGMEGWDMGDDK